MARLFPLVTDQQAAAGFYCEGASLKLLLQFISFFMEVNMVRKHNCGRRQIKEEEQEMFMNMKTIFSCEFVKYRSESFFEYFLFFCSAFLSLLTVSLRPNGGILWSCELLLLLCYCCLIVISIVIIISLLSYIWQLKRHVMHYEPFLCPIK